MKTIAFTLNRLLAVLAVLTLAAGMAWAAAETEQAVSMEKEMVPRISDKGWIGQGSDQDLAELARLHALFDVEMRLGHHS